MIVSILFDTWYALYTFSSGDPRRPYPTDFEMRHGFLGKAGDLPAGSQLLQSQGSYGEPMSSNRSSANTSMGKAL